MPDHLGAEAPAEAVVGRLVTLLGGELIGCHLGPGLRLVDPGQPVPRQRRLGRPGQPAPKSVKTPGPLFGLLASSAARPCRTYVERTLGMAE